MNILDTNILPDVVDLFSGCGGLALGFQSEGFNIVGGVDFNEEAVMTSNSNLHWKFGNEAAHVCEDIKEYDINQVRSNIGPNGCIVIGGPPCQAYSMAGRGKLKSLGEERIHTNDPRGYYYLDFINHALELEAKAVVMENVPESTDFGGLNIPQTVCEILEDNGYMALWSVLNSADYGVPQLRNRVFVVAIKKGNSGKFEFPEATHGPKDETIQNNIKFYNRRFIEFRNYMQSCGSNNRDYLKNWVTVEDAISDLPSLMKNSASKFQNRGINLCMGYRTESQNEFQHMMKNWYGFDNKVVSGNVFRKTERDFIIFENMKPGDNYTDASLIADEILSSKVKDICESTNKDTHDYEYEKIKNMIIPPYSRDKFENKWKRLYTDRPSHTVTAHLGKDTYSHIHPWEPRGISVREAARLQSFPDDFVFNGTIGGAFRQIGNAVPPLLSRNIAKALKKHFV